MIHPSNHAQNVAAALVDAHELQAEVLDEAATSGTESGRSICGEHGDDVNDPVDRSYSNVSLPACPVGNAGLIHGGGGHNWMSPEHSLPDMANVLMGDVDASIVAGTDTSDLMLAPSDEHRSKAIEVFANAVGTGVASPYEVIDAIQSGKVTSPPRARRRIRKKLPMLFRTVSTPHSIPKGVTKPQMMASVSSDAAFKHVTYADSIIQSLRVMVGSIFSFNLSGTKINLADLIVQQTASALILAFFFAVLGTTPSGLVRKNMGQSA